MYVQEIREETKHKEDRVWEVTVAKQESRDRKSHLVVCTAGGESTVQGQKSRERMYIP